MLWPYRGLVALGIIVVIIFVFVGLLRVPALIVDQFDPHSPAHFATSASLGPSGGVLTGW